jgi:hypothetical protein
VPGERAGGGGGGGGGGGLLRAAGRRNKPDEQQGPTGDSEAGNKTRFWCGDSNDNFKLG